MTDQFSEADSLQFEVGGDRQDELFDVLSHSRRRFALQYLQTADTPLPVRELAAELLSWEGRETIATEQGNERDTIEATLVHSHLPKMADVGFVSYDASRKTVSLADRTEEVRLHLPEIVN